MGRAKHSESERREVSAMPNEAAMSLPIIPYSPREQEVKDAVSLAVSGERERCAKIAETQPPMYNWTIPEWTRGIAKKIRSGE